MKYKKLLSLGIILLALSQLFAQKQSPPLTFKLGDWLETSIRIRNFSRNSELLEGHQFIRTHQSHLINFRKISAYVKSDGGYIAMEDGSQVPISRQKKDEVLSRIMKGKF